MPIVVSTIIVRYVRVPLVIPAIHSVDATPYLPHHPPRPLNKMFIETLATHLLAAPTLNAVTSMGPRLAHAWPHMWVHHQIAVPNVQSIQSAQVLRLAFEKNVGTLAPARVASMHAAL